MSEQTATIDMVGKTIRKSAAARYKEGKPIIAEPDLIPSIIDCIRQNGFGFSVDLSDIQVSSFVRDKSDYEDSLHRNSTRDIIDWDKKYVVSGIPGFVGTIVVFAKMRHVPPGHWDNKLTSREEFAVWCKKHKNLERRRKRWHASHSTPGVSYPMPKELFGDMFSAAKPRTGVLVDALDDTELTTGEILGLYVCYDNLNVAKYSKEFIFNKVIAAIQNKYVVQTALRSRLCLYGGDLTASDNPFVFFAHCGRQDSVLRTITNVFKAGTALELAIKKTEDDIARPIIEQFE